MGIYLAASRPRKWLYSTRLYLLRNPHFLFRKFHTFAWTPSGDKKLSMLSLVQDDTLILVHWNRSLHVKFLTQWFTNRFTSIFLNSYLVPRLGGIKQNKCIIHCWPSRWFLLLYFPKPGSQVWILIFRNLSILTFNSENQIFIRGKAPELKKHIYISVLLLFRSK